VARQIHMHQTFVLFNVY